MIKQRMIPENWEFIAGKWEFKNRILTYTYVNPDEKAYGSPHGVALCDIRFIAGRAAVNISFPDQVDDATAAILFGYDLRSRSYYYAGIGGYGYAYDVSQFRPGAGWHAIETAGIKSNIKMTHQYRIETTIQGQEAKLAVDGIPVISCSLPTPLAGNQIGVFAWGTQRIHFESFEAYPARPKAFVVMQFGEPFDHIYQYIIKPVAEQKGLELVRGDDVFSSGVVIRDIFDAIIESDVIIAEITPQNANVFYELGYAHALQKNTILLAKHGTQLPFDLSPFRCIFYDDTYDGRSQLESEIRKHLDAVFR